MGFRHTFRFKSLFKSIRVIPKSNISLFQWLHTLIIKKPIGYVQLVLIKQVLMSFVKTPIGETHVISGLEAF